MSTISVRPITSTDFNVSKARNSRKMVEIRAKELSFFGGFACPKSFSVAGLRRYQDFRRGGFSELGASRSNEDFEPFEQEALVEESLGHGVRTGISATLNNLSKWLVVALFSAIILYKHDAEALWIAMGAVLNSALSVLLKRLLNQERPISTLRSDPGMPSSHAQAIFYAVTFLCLSLVEWNGMNTLSAILSALFLIVGSYFSWLRVWEQLHSPSQVIVGAAIGSIFSIMWVWSWNNFVSSYFDTSLWVRILVISSSIGVSLGFVYYMYSTWIVEES